MTSSVFGISTGAYALTVDARRLSEQVRALDDGRAFVDVSDLRAILVSGPDAARWLNDLVTADVEGLAEGDAVRSLLLSPTGRIRADVHVWSRAEGFLLLQAPDQPRPVDELLAPYVLSSEVALERRSFDGSVVGLPGVPGWRFSAGAPPDATRVEAEALEAWRIGRGVARFPVDLDEDSLPAEAGLDREPVVATAKGCYLGQESVAKIRNFGHPTRVVLRLTAAGPVEVGDPILADGDVKGLVTSANTRDRGVALLARVRWDARESDLRTAGGALLSRP